MPLRTTEDRDRRRDLRAAIDRTGYYPEVVIDGVASSLADEQVVSFYVHHEPTFDRDEVRRHLTVVVLTPTRLVLVHTDEHAGDDLLPEPYTSTSTEAIRLFAVKSVVVTRMVTNPTSGTAKPAEAVVTIGWGGVGRIDLEPAGCDDPELRRRPRLHGCPLLRRLLAARLGGGRGPTRSAGCCPSPSRCRPARTRDRRDAVTEFVEPAYSHRSLGDVVPAVAAALGRPSARHRRTCCCPTRRRTSSSSSTASAPALIAALPARRAVPGRAAGRQRDRARRVCRRRRRPASPRSAPGSRPGRTAWWVSRPGSPAPNGCSTRCTGTRRSTRSSGSRTPPRSQEEHAGVAVTVVNKASSGSG